MKDKKILYGIIVAFVFLLSIGLTYAYFSVTTTVVGDRNDIKAEIGTLNILYTDGPEILAESVQPGWTTTKTIKVENTGSLKAFYSIDWASITNEITNDELILSAICTSDTGACDNIASTPITGEKIVSRQGINPGEEQTYVITFEFTEISSTQNYNQGKKFNGVLNVIDENESFTVTGTLLDVNGNPVAGGTVEIHSEVRTGTTDANGNFEIKDVEVGDHEIIFKNSSNEVIATDTFKLISSSVDKLEGKEITGDTDKGVVELLIELNNSSSIGTIQLGAVLKSKILSENTVYRDDVSSPYVTSASGVDFKAKSTLTNGQGLYTNNKLEDGSNKYFRGGSFCAYTDYTIEDSSGTKCTAVGGTWTDYKCSLDLNRTTCSSKGFTYYDLKNNVLFAGHKWRIIRIDENDNIRMILADDDVVTSHYNASTPDNTYVGYMYGDTSLIQSSLSNGFVFSDELIYYGSSYAVNASNQFYLTGTLVSGLWNTESICTESSCPVAGYYTCKSTSSSGTCDSLWKVDSWISSTGSFYFYELSHASQSNVLAHNNANNSTIKTAVDSWYSSNMTDYTNYIADAGYCSDRSLTSGLGYAKSTTYYKGYTRNYPDSTASPRLNINSYCSNPTRDLFTKTSSTGNQKLTYPAGLITADELRYAGMVYYASDTSKYNFSNYLKLKGFYWTMSPAYYNSSSYVYYVHYFGSLGYRPTYGGGSVRTVISLKPTTIARGAGTYDDPYVVE